MAAKVNFFKTATPPHHLWFGRFANSRGFILVHILDSDDASEPEKAEALRELEEIAEFQKHHARRSQDSARNAADAVRKAIRRLHRNLAQALDPKGDPDPVLRPFALHLQQHLLIPSARYSSHHAPRSTLATLNHRMAGCLTYEPPPTVSWPA